jgi:hypothetical protein
MDPYLIEAAAAIIVWPFLIATFTPLTVWSVYALANDL